MVDRGWLTQSCMQVGQLYFYLVALLSGTQAPKTSTELKKWRKHMAFNSLGLDETYFTSSHSQLTKTSHMSSA